MKRTKMACLFTLVELLIIISIIAILASMLLPALNKARDTSIRIACLNNFKQIGVALPMYVDDYNEYYPSKVATPDGGTYNWQNTFRMYGWAKKLFEYTNSFDIAYCPKDTEWNTNHPKTPDDARMGWYPVSYPWRYPLAAAAEGGYLGRAIKINDMRYPTQQVVINEFRSWHSPIVQLLGPHSAQKLSSYIKSNALYADGHAEAWTIRTYNGAGYWETGFTVSTQAGSQWWDPRSRHD